jgi:hypothetical protein
METLYEIAFITTLSLVAYAWTRWHASECNRDDRSDREW